LFEWQLVAPKGQCTNHTRRAAQSPLARAVFQLDAWPGNGPRSLVDARVRVVGRHVGRGPCLLVCAPRSCPDGLAAAVG
jgi:hypothetical protein